MKTMTRKGRFRRADSEGTTLKGCPLKGGGKSVELAEGGGDEGGGVLRVLPGRRRRRRRHHHHHRRRRSNSN